MGYHSCASIGDVDGGCSVPQSPPSVLLFGIPVSVYGRHVLGAKCHADRLAHQLPLDLGRVAFRLFVARPPPEIHVDMFFHTAGGGFLQKSLLVKYP